MKRQLLTFFIVFHVCVACGYSQISHSFDTQTGRLNVDYESELNKVNWVWNAPITEPQKGMTIGSGKVGFMVWHENGIMIEGSNVDGSPQTQMSSARVNLHTVPSMDSDYSNMEQRIDLYNGIGIIKYDDNRTVTIFSDPKTELMGIHVEDQRNNVSSVTVDLNNWDATMIENHHEHFMFWLEYIDMWKSWEKEVTNTSVAYSRAQSEPDNWGYTMSVSVDGANYTTEEVGSKLRLNITPSNSYTIWVANASRMNAPNHDSKAEAKALIDKAKADGYEQVLARCKSFWNDFWTRSYVEYRGVSEADMLINYYYLNNYQLATGSMAKYPYHFIQGVHSANGDSTARWAGDYTYFNLRDHTNYMLASNRLDLMDPYFNVFIDNLQTFVDETLEDLNMPGAMIGERFKWNGDLFTTRTSGFVSHTHNSTLEIIENMYWKYAYTGRQDTAWLEKVYPLFKEVATWFVAYIDWDGTQYNMLNSSALEDYWGIDGANNPLPTLAAIRVSFPMIIETAEILGVDPDLRTQLQHIVDNLAPLPTTPFENGERYIACDNMFEQNKYNGQFSEIEGVWPNGLSGIDSPDYQTAINTLYNSRIHGFYTWSPDHVVAARLGEGQTAYTWAIGMINRASGRGNGLLDDGNGVMESAGLNISFINESLLHSHNDIIRVFPALPDDAGFNGRFTLLAMGGFLVSSEREESATKYIGIKSLYGNEITIANPWGTEELQVREVGTGILLTTSDSKVTFNTQTDGVYVVESTSNPLGMYTQKIKRSSQFQIKGYRAQGSGGILRVDYSNFSGGRTRVKLYDIQGTLLSEKEKEGLSGSGRFSLHFDVLPKGVKIVAFESDHAKTVHKFNVP